MTLILRLGPLLALLHYLTLIGGFLNLDDALDTAFQFANFPM